MRLVTEMRASFEKLTHRNVGKRHMLFLRLDLGGQQTGNPPPERPLKQGRLEIRLWDAGRF